MIFPLEVKSRESHRKKGCFIKQRVFCDEFFISSPYMIDKSCNIKQQIYAIYFLPALTNDCRTIQFVTKVKILKKNHVIRNVSVRRKSQCMSQCLGEPNCVSYSYGPLHSDTPTCELNNRTQLASLQQSFYTKGRIHQPTHLVKKTIIIGALLDRLF